MGDVGGKRKDRSTRKKETGMFFIEYPLAWMIMMRRIIMMLMMMMTTTMITFII